LSWDDAVLTNGTSRLHNTIPQVDDRTRFMGSLLAVGSTVRVGVACRIDSLRDFDADMTPTSGSAGLRSQRPS
jgi:hypothetical protein